MNRFNNSTQNNKYVNTQRSEGFPRVYSIINEPLIHVLVCARCKISLAKRRVTICRLMSSESPSSLLLSRREHKNKTAYMQATGANWFL